jgi:hypothetical protein
VTVGPGVAPSGDEEPHVDLDVEEDERREGQQAQQDRPRHVHVVLDVHGVISVRKRAFQQYLFLQKLLYVQHESNDPIWDRCYDF